ncbi:MAG: hypothetical protein ACK55I_11735, partial [bacterium]
MGAGGSDGHAVEEEPQPRQHARREAQIEAGEKGVHQREGEHGAREDGRPEAKQKLPGGNAERERALARHPPTHLLPHRPSAQGRGHRRREHPHGQPPGDTRLHVRHRRRGAGHGAHGHQPPPRHIREGGRP